MLLEFLAAIVVGLAAAGVVMAINVVIRRRLPGWLVPAAAGISMIAFMVWMEYNWLPRTIASLPEGVEVVSVSRESSWYRPWTYFRPLSLRAVTLDTRRNRTHPAQPGQVMTSVVLLGRWMPPRQIPVVFDCDANRRADLHAAVELDADGYLSGADWRELPADDPALAIACRSVR
ncbi:hypothetical protein [Thioalkalivibrio sp. XN8]|uniref:hypothetical protein n=1 Tax=Thioalkalivibrio sp. XN8 TaxID=2712863 RepID=UPI0013EBF332|nr:hypothetical protein [Thioalkalivibrio sp. XN8]NGP53533.1 hypothetical protein [Thioalkalivibrio sp. XN8]